jgi:hypothetical protein
LKQIDEPAQEKPTHINAFQLIGMASSLDLSGFFEEEVCICTDSFSFIPFICHPDHNQKIFCTVQLTSQNYYNPAIIYCILKQLWQHSSNP